MVGLNSDLHHIDSKLSPLIPIPANVPDHLFIPNFDSPSYFNDPFPDFDSIEDWFIDPESVLMPTNDDIAPCPHMSASIKIENQIEPEFSSVSIEKDMERVSLIGACDSNSVNSTVDEESTSLDAVGGKEKDIDESKEEVKLKESGDGVNEVSSINTPLLMEKEKDITTVEDAVCAGIVSNVNSSGSGVSESESDSSSSSTGEEEETDDDDDDDKVEEEEEEGSQMDDVEEVEEGEIRDFDKEDIVADSDAEEEVVIKGPIKSKNELEMMSTKVIVEGLEKHSPLNEGSILWITESRLPLGIVDEIFGPVKSPYYVVRYNSEKEVPAGIREGTAISFAAEFANLILNNQSLYKKGYDLSGENDEEVSECEFSDDEKEAEYRRQQKMGKRGMDGQKSGNKEFVGHKKVQGKGRFQKNVRPSVPRSPMGVAQPTVVGEGPPYVPNQLQMPPPVTAPFGCGNCQCSFGTGQVGTSGHATIQPGSHVAQLPGFLGGPPQHLMPPNGNWTNGMPAQQLQMALPSGFHQMDGNPCPQQQGHQHPNQQQHHMFMAFPNGTSHHQQFDPSLRPNCGVSPYGQLNISAGSSPMCWPGLMGPGNTSQLPFGMGFQGQGHHNVGQGGFCNEQSYSQLPPTTVHQGSFPAAPQQFNPGMTSFRGRKPHPRGRGGYHTGGRGWRQSG
ncbi:uncharacterized protein LOC143893023 isoform X2 [Tasmannia lanceolata]|uniref:uncharacterized protein LOC143893023 isoform X2 n=1 Tax=Tasmannia lanceolata TaxID=3420 RepID=UPI0040632CE8